MVALARPWKDERLVLRDARRDLRVLAVRPGDPARHWDKAREALEVADEFLGSAAGAPGLLRQPGTGIF